MTATKRERGQVPPPEPQAGADEASAPTGDADGELTAREAGALLGLKASTISGYIRSGRLPERYDGEPSWGGWMTTRAAVEAYRSRQYVNPRHTLRGMSEGGLADEAQKPAGFVQTFPLRITEAPFDIEGTYTTPLSWHVPALFGIRGRVQGRPDDVAIIGYEWPIPKIRLEELLSKSRLERTHLDQFCSEHLVMTGVLPYENLRRGSEPPDFVTIAAGTEVGLDCTQFAIPSRRSANALFGRIRKAVLCRDRARFAHLRGCMVYMWFGTEAELTALPHSARDAAAIEEVAEALADYPVDVTTLRSAAELPRFNLERSGTRSGCTFYAAPMVGPLPDTSFFASTGFELGIGYQTSHDSHSLWRELGRLIERHDQPSIDHLLVTVVGPDRNGFAFPSEGALTDFMLGQPEPLERPSHLLVLC